MRNGSSFLFLLVLVLNTLTCFAYAHPSSQESGDESQPSLRSPVAFKGPVEYDCTQAGGNHKLHATFYQTTPAMVLLNFGRQVRPAFQVISADGSRYEGQDLMFWEARGKATVIWLGFKLTCKPR